jgi:hypothetical protein
MLAGEWPYLWLDATYLPEATARTPHRLGGSDIRSCRRLSTPAFKSSAACQPFVGQTFVVAYRWSTGSLLLAEQSLTG